MRRMLDILLAFPLLASSAQAQTEAIPVQEAIPAEAVEAEPMGSKKPKQQVIDLNQIDLEQVEEDWDSTPKQQTIVPKNRLKLNDIIQPTADYSYASFGKADPFQSPDFSSFQPALGADAGGSGAPGMPASASGSEIAIGSPLQAYPLADLKVKGVWKLENGEIRSLVQTPKNEGVVVKVGDPISSGKVIGIDREAIVVRLYTVRKDGVREYRDQRMPFGLPKAELQGVIKLEPGKDAQFVTPDAVGLQPAASLNGIAAPGGVQAPAGTVGAPGGVPAGGPGAAAAPAPAQNNNPVVPATNPTGPAQPASQRPGAN